MAIVGLVLGIIALVYAFVPVLGIFMLKWRMAPHDSLDQQIWLWRKT